MMWWTARAIDRLRRSLLTPVCFRVSQRTSQMPNQLTYAVTAGPVADSDVATRTVTLTVNGESRGSKDYPAETLSFDPITVSQGDAVVMTLVDTDDAGNPSAPAVVEFAAADTIPPSQPGLFSVQLVSES